MSGRFRFVPLTRAHDRSQFCSGVDNLDLYIREQVWDCIEREVTHCFVALDPADRIAAYCSFSATSLALTELDVELARLIPRYPLIPAIMIGWLAVDQDYQGRGLGAALIVEILRRTARIEPGIFGLVVEAKDDDAESFYHHLGFTAFDSRPYALYLPIAQAIKQVLGAE